MSAGMIVLVVLNTAVSVGGMGFAAVAAARPTTLSHGDSSTKGERLYAWMYAIRGIPFGLLTAVVPFLEHGPAAVLCLLAAAVAQVGDAWIGVHRHENRQIVGPTLAAVIHLITAIAIS
ncbi:hypothetical protein AB0B27_18830 [Micromonospora rifamycinica]|uniref:hypothetical protein n=1 Tax=Micromonospora rifamycinica TaxID=291594 RepID=UPI0033F87911